MFWDLGLQVDIRFISMLQWAEFRESIHRLTEVRPVLNLEQSYWAVLLLIT